MVTLRQRKPKTVPVKAHKGSSSRDETTQTFKAHHKTMSKSHTQRTTKATTTSGNEVLNEFLEKAKGDPIKSKDISHLYNMIRDAAPDLTPELQGTATLAFGGFDYQTKSKCTGRWAHLGIMLNKTGLSIMVSGEIDGKYVLQHFDKKMIAKKSSAVSLGKSCIRFKTMEDLNIDQLSDIFKAAAKADISSLAV